MRRLAAALLIALCGAPLQGQVTVLKGGTLIDGTGGPAVENATLVIERNRIKTVGRDIDPPPGARVVDASGRYILPGLWDKHLHYKDWMPEFLITNGVTSVWAQGGGAWLNAQREGIEKGKILGPRMFLRQFSINEFRDPDIAARRVDEVIELGAAYIKVYTSVTPEVLRAVTGRAHRRGFVVEGHLGISARDAVLAGIDGLTHSSGIALSVVGPEALEEVPRMRVFDYGRRRVVFPRISVWNESREGFSPRSLGTGGGGPNPDLTEYWLFVEDPRRLMLLGMMDRDRARDLIDLMVRENVYMESCLTYLFRNVHDRVQEYRREDHLLLSDPDLAYVPEKVRRDVLDYSLLDLLRPEELELMRRAYRNFQWFIRTFVSAGGRVAVGPDTTSNNHATMLPGVSTRRELELLVDAGLTPMQAILAATRWPARILGRELGSLEPGKLADLVVLSRNPLADITAFKDVEMVMQDGRFLPVGYHHDFANPIPWPPANRLDTADWGIPTRIRRLVPDVIAEGSGAFTLRVEGEGFLSSSVVRFGDRLMDTRLLGPARLEARIPAAAVKSPGAYPVRVEHRPPEWGKSNPLYFVVKFR